MRKFLTAVLSVLATVTLLTAGSSPAAADDAGAAQWHYFGQNTETIGCTTPYRTGVLGQYGAWGYFIDGCTARGYCPTWTRSCRMTGEGWIGTYNSLGHQVTLNSRLTRRAANGAVLGWQDMSCISVNYCTPTPIVVYIAPGQSVSEQCNGVRANAVNTASVRCHVYLEELY
ncbi:hypothetical protein ACQP2P_21170 [Dactylosporangium sp. CA-139114]|uniref:hypothetical protein n=1 Tax=Dactylosporangium sp. CA-139114 TaxID=3239931 RepID=UPI003D99CEF8